MTDFLRVVSLRYLDGHAFEVAGRAALLELEVSGAISQEVLAHLETPGTLTALNPGEPLPGMRTPDWVAGYLVGGRGSAPLAEITAALITAVQLWCRSPVPAAQVMTAPPGRIRIALAWHRQNVLRDAVDFTIAYISAVMGKKAGFDAPGELAGLLSRVQPDGVSPNSLRFACAAMARDMPVTVLNGQTLQIGWGANARLMKSSFTDRTSALGERLARHKYHCNLRLHRAHLPVADSRIVYDLEAARESARDLGWSVVVKPAALDQGQGVHVGVETPAALEAAFQDAAARSAQGVLIERFVPGDDHRLLVVQGRLLMACRRIPGGVIGDGTTPVRGLLDRLNADPLRGDDLRSLLIRIPVDAEALACLDAAGLNLDSVPEAGQTVALRRTANISTGGTAVDVTAQVHPDNRIAAVRAARIVGLDIAGVDFICPDISVSYRVGGGAICEVNAQPGFRPHWLGAVDRDINAEVLDVLFQGKAARIPTAAITGTNGKSTTAMMLHHIWQTAGRTAGVCTTAGTWIGADQVDTRNLSGVPGASLLFGDPAVEAAVLEVPRRGLILFGQPCDRYDVAAFLNLQEDHLGQDGINTLDEMANLKAGVIRRARNAVVVNAEDPRCLKALETVSAPRHILVAMSAGAPALAAHLERGGDGVFLTRDSDDGAEWITMARGAQRVPVLKVSDIPATLQGHLRFNVMNAMFAIALADAQNLPGDAIRAGLSRFNSSREMNPGRYNMVPGLPCAVMVDYAHNKDGMQELCRVVSDLPVKGRRHLVLRMLGTSGPAEVHSTARFMLGAFDRITVLPDSTLILKNGFFKSDDPIGEMLQVTRDAILDHGGSSRTVTVARDDAAAIHAALAGAAADDLVVVVSDPNVAYRHIDTYLGSP